LTTNYTNCKKQKCTQGGWNNANENQVPQIRKMIRNNANANVLHGFNATTSLGTPLNDAPKVMDSLQNEKPCFGNYDDGLRKML
jgi:hypothetical protein